MTLTYKPIPPEDHEAFVQIDSLVYGDKIEEARRWVASPAIGPLRGLYDADRLVSQCVIFPFVVRTGPGAALPCGGLASVGTPPELRRRGLVGRLLREVCDELLGGGTHLCMLGAFKESFYRRYGWASAFERRVFRGEPDDFAWARKQSAGEWTRVGNEGIPVLDEVYRGAFRGRFGPLMRTPEWWQHNVLKHEFSQEAQIAYVWRDEHGAARAYLLYRLEDKRDDKLLEVAEAAALDPLARAQIFAFWSNYDSQVQKVVFPAPADAPVNLLFPDPLECTLEPGHMLRVLDVAGLLTSLTFPTDANGHLTLRVADDWLDHNQGVFVLEVAEGRAACRRVSDDAEADLRLDVRVLAQFVSRVVRPRTAAAFGLLEVHSRPALALLDQLFAGLAPYCLDYF
jgi:predicted acetyltransferase